MSLVELTLSTTVITSRINSAGVSMADLDQTIEDMAQLPQSTSTDGTSMTERSIDELIRARNFLVGKKAKRSNGFGMKCVSVKYPGSQR